MKAALGLWRCKIAKHDEKYNEFNDDDDDDDEKIYRNDVTVEIRKKHYSSDSRS